MPKIRPISDLRNNFTEISRIVHESKEPVFLTKNGYGDMVELVPNSVEFEWRSITLVRSYSLFHLYQQRLLTAEFQ
jgi:hypothetical protein